MMQENIYVYIKKMLLALDCRGGTAPDAGPITIKVGCGTYDYSNVRNTFVLKNFTITGPTAALALIETAY
jgi:hypothetical protein